MLGYVVAPQYYDQGHRSNTDDMLFGVDSEVMKILKGIFQLNKYWNYIRIKYPLQD